MDIAYVICGHMRVGAVEKVATGEWVQTAQVKGPQQSEIDQFRKRALFRASDILYWQSF